MAPNIPPRPPPRDVGKRKRDDDYVSDDISETMKLSCSKCGKMRIGCRDLTPESAAEYGVRFRRDCRICTGCRKGPSATEKVMAPKRLKVQ